MLFSITWTAREDYGIDRQEKLLGIFSKWTPPAGFEFKSFYVTAGLDGGCAIVEAQSAAAIAEVTALYIEFFTYSITPVLEPEQAVEILQRSRAG